MLTLAVALVQIRFCCQSNFFAYWLPLFMTSVLLLDDHPIVTNGLSAYLTSLSDIEIIGKVSSPADALSFLQRYQPEVLVSDMSFGDQVEGVRLLISLRERFPGIRVVFYSMVEKSDHVRDAILAGARAYVLKKYGAEEVYRAICAVRDNGIHYSPELVPILVQSGTSAQKDEELNPLSALTQREHEVMVLIAKEYSTREIAEKLFIAESTIQSHRTNLMTKLGVKSNVGIAFFAFKYGLA